MRRTVLILICGWYFSGGKSLVSPLGPSMLIDVEANQTTSADSFHLRALLSGPSVRLDMAGLHQWHLVLNGDYSPWVVMEAVLDYGMLGRDG
jgi:hypothetical protein